MIGRFLADWVDLITARWRLCDPAAEWVDHDNVKREFDLRQGKAG